MTNLASEEKVIGHRDKCIFKKEMLRKTEFSSINHNIYQKQNVVYGCFEQTDNEMVKENAKRMRKAEVKAGISLGLKLFISAFWGVVLAQFLFEWQNIKTESLPAFIFMLMWIACAGSLFCITGLLRNMIDIAFRK